jgi:hypothetical protein
MNDFASIRLSWDTFENRSGIHSIGLVGTSLPESELFVDLQYYQVYKDQ